MVLSDPFFWAFISAFSLAIGLAMVAGIKPGSNSLLGFAVIIVNDLSRIVLVLPFCIQPRFEIGVFNWIAGGIVLAIALAVGVPALSINWRTAPDNKTVLKTDGVYGIIRNPIYVADILFALGFAIMFRSIVGIVLVPIWCISFVFIILVEEASLARAIGKPYLDYKRRVKARLVPGLPF